MESFRSNADTQDPLCLKHLDLLIDFIQTTYKSTARRLFSLLAKGEITYDLLWALVRPNSTVYTTCLGTQKPRCTIYDGGEEKETSSGLKYFNMECRYLDYDGQVFGEASIDIPIVKFRGKKRISTLKGYPLQYHPDEKRMKTQLVECGRKFVSMLGAYHRHCRGTAFYIKDREVLRVSVNSRIMLDAAFFRKMNPSYPRPQPDELARNKADDDNNGWFSEPSSERTLDQIKDNGTEPTQLGDDDLLICCPTVPGFSLGDKLWRIIISSPHCRSD